MSVEIPAFTPEEQETVIGILSDRIRERTLLAASDCAAGRITPRELGWSVRHAKYLCAVREKLARAIGAELIPVPVCERCGTEMLRAGRAIPCTVCAQLGAAQE